jgi:hypothetical protein
LQSSPIDYLNLSTRDPAGHLVSCIPASFSHPEIANNVRAAASGAAIGFDLRANSVEAGNERLRKLTCVL